MHKIQINASAAQAFALFPNDNHIEAKNLASELTNRIETPRISIE